MLSGRYVHMQNNKKTVLLSIYPRYASKILSGEKRLEFRKAWSTTDISSFVIYATSPVQRIVGIAKIKQVHGGSPTKLWQLAQQMGGGVTRRTLYEYFKGRSEGFAIEISSVLPSHVPLDPADFIPNFAPPQSFTYLDGAVVKKIETAIRKQRPVRKIIFVAGVHGVGKTSLCEAAVEGGSAIHKSASQLIREERASAIAVGSKVVQDIDGNQKLLVNAVRKISGKGEFEPLLLDGHFALVNKSGRPEALPVNLFSELGIDGVILVKDRPSRIAARLLTRDGGDTPLEDVAALQKLEVSQAVKICAELGLPLHQIEAFDHAAFGEALISLSGKTGRA
jgi:adenylate kinase